MTVQLPFGVSIESIANEALRERGHANVYLTGRAGAGKSTLVNAVFDGDLARVGQGRPVTRDTKVYSRPGVPLSLYDNRGLEMAAFHAIMAEQERYVCEANDDADANNHIHVGWICIAEDLRRVEDAEIEMTRMLARHMPVIAVITKARNDSGFSATVAKLLPEAKAVVRVRALTEELDDGHVLPPRGLTDLVEATCRLFPEGQRRAFVAAQKVDLELKRENARAIVVRHAVYALGIAANPFPFADQAGLAGIYVSMFAGISAAYGLSPSARTLAAYLAAAVGAPATTLTASLVASSLLKLIPGVGTIAGQALSAGVAPMITTTIGLAYIELLHGLYGSRAGRTPDDGAVVDALRTGLGDILARQQGLPAVVTAVPTVPALGAGGVGKSAKAAGRGGPRRPKRKAISKKRRAGSSGR